LKFSFVSACLTVALFLFFSNLPLKLLLAASNEDEYQDHLNHRGEYKSTRNEIATAQYECFQRILKEPQRPVCNATWDGWLCWEETDAGHTEQSCPDYFKDFDPHVCSETGEWGRHPQSNRTWTNFTNCRANTIHHGKVRRGKNTPKYVNHRRLFFLSLPGHLQAAHVHPPVPVELQLLLDAV
uniref:G-protein coupled receptors family 2 profile 1 domain-containing protein n=1 Tax=Cyclopterus lumpus TaxID=8103 RepID=A0A8C2YYU6_CYCLU